MKNLPVEVSALESFLVGSGLGRTRTESDGGFDNLLIEHQGRRVSVQIIRERGRWSVDLAFAGRRGEWYDIALLRDLIRGPGEDALPLPEQVALVQELWPELLDRFDRHGPKTHERLAQLREARMRRMGWLE